MKMCRYKSHENAYMQISRICIHANLMKMYTCKSHGNWYMESHENVQMEISWICIYANLMKMNTCKSHENV